MSQTVTPALLILAAGMSSRYGGGSKQTDAMGPSGETLLDYSVYDAKRAGFGRIVFIIRREGEATFREKVVSRLEPHIPVALVYQEMTDLPTGFTPPPDRQKPWGTGHAVWAARHEVKEPFCAINADDYYGRHSFRVMADFLRRSELNGTPAEWSMVGFQLRKTLSEYGKVARGICSVQDGLLTGVEELTDIHRTPEGAENRPDGKPVRPLTGGETVSLNMWGFTPSLFDEFGQSFAAFLKTNGTNPKAEFYIPFGVDVAIQKGAATCRVLPTESQWFGVTYQDDKPRVIAAVKALVDAGEYPSPLW
ncbi:MAG TPA: nucleotidyltransferase [Verrucomicrobiales bacterium]|nr:nucleotidyltransferase [Verrucomicrobiales bacterium]